MAVGYSKGAQDNGVAVCIKHFALNNQENNRGSVNAIIGEHAMREIYLPPFRTAVEEADVYGVMAAYNKVNGWCLVDQLAGQYLAHVCNLGYLAKKENVSKTLKSIMKYNYKSDLSDHFNCFRSYALGNEAALLMESYPGSRPANPFPYFTEVMTGFEYMAAIGMLYEGQTDEGLKCISNIRNRYDGRMRSPFNEAECGHHYGRAMASWSAVLALSCFNYSGVTKELRFTNREGKYFWSNGYSYGTARISKGQKGMTVVLDVLNGSIELNKVTNTNTVSETFRKPIRIGTGESESITI